MAPVGKYATGGFIGGPNSDNATFVVKGDDYDAIGRRIGLITKISREHNIHPRDVALVLQSFAAAKESEVKSMSKDIVIGSSVVYIDTLGNERPALVTNLFGPIESNPSINVVFVNDDEAQTDTYGRKTERASSVVHHSHQYAHGNKWKPVSE